MEKGELPIDLPTSGGSTTRAAAADLENEVIEVENSVFLRRAGTFLIPLPFTFKEVDKEPR